MTRGPISGWASRLAGASLTLLAGLLLATGSAEAAGCGRQAGADPGLRAQLDRVRDEAPPAPMPARPPCSGPGCSEGRPPAPAPTPDGPVRGPREWGTLPTDPVPEPPPAAPVGADEPVARPARVASFPDRPPRRPD